MSASPAHGPFFLSVEDRGPDARSGERFCFFHAPADGAIPRGAVLAVHAFAEEMNRTRAAVADGARALARAGYAVLQVDLLGCGDSAGDFADATWTAWLADLDAAWRWLAPRAPGPRWLWGTRLGALLADRFAATCTPASDGLLLWQPVVSGAQHLGQFLRLKTVGGLLRGAAAGDAPSTPVAQVEQPSPRADLASGRAIEVAGYRLTPVLADAVEAARLGPLEGQPGRAVPRVRWLDVSSQPTPTIAPVATRVVERWRAAGTDVTVTTVPGPAFWQTQETERCPALVDATVVALVGPVAAASSVA